MNCSGWERRPSMKVQNNRLSHKPVNSLRLFTSEQRIEMNDTENLRIGNTRDFDFLCLLAIRRAEAPEGKEGEVQPDEARALSRWARVLKPASASKQIRRFI